MGFFDNVLLVSDIDGTLMENQQIPRANLKAINRFKQQGGFFTIATGRSAGAVKDIYFNIGCNAPAVISNGTEIYDFYKQKYLSVSEFPLKANKIFLDICDNFKNIGAEVHINGDVKIVNNTESIRKHLDYVKLNGEEVSREELLNLRWTKAVMVSPDQEAYESLLKYVQNIKTDLVSFVRTGKNYLEMTQNGMSKATACKKLKKMFGDKIKLATIGDYDNDFDMVRQADIGAAVGNAQPCVKEVAKYITCNCEDGAVADFIKYLEQHI